jgi:hypothetical protein
MTVNTSTSVNNVIGDGSMLIIKDYPIDSLVNVVHSHIDIYLSKYLPSHEDNSVSYRLIVKDKV